MIVSKTPLRMSYVGGGSDLPVFYKEEMGAVISTTINRFVYVCVNKKFDDSIRLSYSKTEEVDSPSELHHPIAREALNLLEICGGIEISSTADIPSHGSGLGSSSSFTVGLLNALYAYKNIHASRSLLASNACLIEIDKCDESIGKQDQYAAAYGGFNFITFQPNEVVSVDPIICSHELLKGLEENTLVFFTGRTRSASKILIEQSREMLKADKRLLVRQMVKLAFDLKSELESGSLDNFGAILDKNWRLKRQLTAGISDANIEEIYMTGIKNGAIGGKLLGAGNGGFIMFYAPLQAHKRIICALSKLRMVKFSMERGGSQIVFYQPSE